MMLQLPKNSKPLFIASIFFFPVVKVMCCFQINFNRSQEPAAHLFIVLTYSDTYTNRNSKEKVSLVTSIIGDRNHKLKRSFDSEVVYMYYNSAFT